jgi:hypothetical protein
VTGSDLMLTLIFRAEYVWKKVSNLACFSIVATVSLTGCIISERLLVFASNCHVLWYRSRSVFDLRRDSPVNE